MMFNDRVLWAIAQEQHRQRLAEAEARRLAKQFQTTDKGEGRLRQEIAWRLGEVLIVLGRKLQAEPRESLG
jgi:hypothetical protein